MNYNVNKYYREKPVREFDLNKTLYTTIKDVNKDYENLSAIGFLGYNMTYKELLINVDRLADAYLLHGVKENDTVAICTISMPLVQENLLALSKIGATSKWIDLRNKPKDLIKNINESNCKIAVIYEGLVPIFNEILSNTNLEMVVVASPKDYLNPFIHVLADLKDKREGKLIKLPDDKRFIKYEDFLKKGSVNSLVKPVNFEKERPSLIVQSSGSTGVPKSIVHTEYNFNSEMQKEAYSDLPFQIGGVMHDAIPPFIIYGLCNSVYAALAFSMKSQMTPYVADDIVFNDLGKFDYSCAAPLHYRYICNKITELQDRITELSKGNLTINQKELSSTLKELKMILQKISNVKVFVSGGDKITAEELLKMEHILNKVIVNGYGNNELTGAAIISPVYASKPDAVGIPMKGITVKTFDAETMEELNIGEIGEICIQTDSMFVKYLNNEEETNKVKKLHSDGKYWIHTGDLGYVNNEGYVYIIGRSKRLIKRSAFKIAPDTIENIILNIPEINDCVVVGVPDKEELFVPMAYIEIKPEYIMEQEKIRNKVLEFCLSELPDYEVPKYINIIDKIPYNNNKKGFKELEEMGTKYVKETYGKSRILEK